MKNLDPVNRKYMEDYTRHSTLQGLKPASVGIRLWKTYAFLKFIQFRDIKTISRGDVEDYYLSRKDAVSPFTLQGDLSELKQFIRWLMGEDIEKEFFKSIKHRKPKRHLPSEAVINEEDVRDLLRVVDSQRDRAMIMLLWDSGARLGEVLGLDVGHVQFDRHGATIIVDGKTGMRRIRLIDSVPDLQRWVEMHPARTNPKAPLFISLRGPGIERLKHRSVEGRMVTLAKRAGITKRIHPHGFRHGKLTALTKEGFTESDLKLIAGWTPGSNMAETYVHLSMRDVEQKVLAKKGLIKEEEQTLEALLRPKACPRCGKTNPHDMMYCGACSLILDPKAAISFEQKRTRIRVSSEYEDLNQRIDQLERRLGN